MSGYFRISNLYLWQGQHFLRMVNIKTPLD
jgi:hypothetical protein